LTPGRNLPVQPDHHNRWTVGDSFSWCSKSWKSHKALDETELFWLLLVSSGNSPRWANSGLFGMQSLRLIRGYIHVFNGPLAILHIHINAGWWFQTFLELSISYMGCHPSHWRTQIF
jgi:hypothetical protein